MKHEASGDPSAPKFSLFVCVVCLLAASALLYAPLRAEFLKIEPWTADWRTVLLSDKRTGPHPTVAVVVINKDTLAGYPYHSPTPRDLLISVLKAMPETPAESIRIVVVNYLTACLLGAKNEKETCRLLDLLQEFSRPYISSEKLGPLLLSFGNLLFR